MILGLPNCKARKRDKGVVKRGVTRVVSLVDARLLTTHASAFQRPSSRTSLANYCGGGYQVHHGANLAFSRPGLPPAQACVGQKLGACAVARGQIVITENLSMHVGRTCPKSAKFAPALHM